MKNPQHRFLCHSTNAPSCNIAEKFIWNSSYITYSYYKSVIYLLSDFVDLILSSLLNVESGGEEMR